MSRVSITQDSGVKQGEFSLKGVDFDSAPIYDVDVSLALHDHILKRIAGIELVSNERFSDIQFLSIRCQFHPLSVCCPPIM